MWKSFLQKVDKIVNTQRISRDDNILYDILVLMQNDLGICEEQVLNLAEVLQIEPIVIWACIAKNPSLRYTGGLPVVRVCAGMTCSSCPNKDKHQKWLRDHLDLGHLSIEYSCLGMCESSPVIFLQDEKVKV